MRAMLRLSHTAERGHYETYAVCGWEDDRADNNRRDGGPDAPGGPNRISLSQARANFASFGASSQRRSMFAAIRDPKRYPRGAEPCRCRFEATAAIDGHPATVAMDGAQHPASAAACRAVR